MKKKEEKKKKKGTHFQGCLRVPHVCRNGRTGSVWVFSLLLPTCHMFSVLSESGRLSGQAEASYHRSYLRSVSLAQHRRPASLRANHKGRQHFCWPFQAMLTSLAAAGKANQPLPEKRLWHCGGLDGLCVTAEVTLTHPTSTREADEFLSLRVHVCVDHKLQHWQHLRGHRTPSSCANIANP